METTKTPSPQTPAGKLARITFAVALITGSSDSSGFTSSSSSAYEELSAWGGSALSVALDPYKELIDPLDAPLPLPLMPVAQLIEAIATLSAAVGIPQDPTTAVLDAQLGETIAGRLANVVLALHHCTLSTNAALNGNFAALPQCATTLAQASRDLEHELPQIAASAASKAPLDIWPVLYVDFAKTNNFYANDYLLIADPGGNDVYANNAGSNVVDINFSPASSKVVGVRGVGPARGCQRAIPGLTAADCILAAAVLIDTAGDDIYGVKESPDVDAECTPDPVIRRMLTNAVGFTGVGILIDSQGNDVYTSKTVSNGAGHFGGIGILWDRTGDDLYTSVRSSQGFALFGGFGLLRDQSGDDQYDYYIPGPLIPGAPNETPGAGGVIDDTNLCDTLPRFIQGGAEFIGVGALIDDAGEDSYHGGFVSSFGTPATLGLPPGSGMPGPAPSGGAGSQAFGNNGAFGVLFDRGGHDSYQIDGDQGLPLRADGVVIGPDATCVNSTCLGLFIDQ